jgi:hypothetical protein
MPVASSIELDDRPENAAGGGGLKKSIFLGGYSLFHAETQQGLGWLVSDPNPPPPPA